MKKKLLSLLTVSTLVMSIFSGCSSKSETTSEATTSSEKATVTETTKETSADTENTEGSSSEATAAETTTEGVTTVEPETTDEPDQGSDQIPVISSTEIKDGTYRGYISQVSSDGKTVVITLGQPITFTQEEVSKMNVGDQIAVNCRDIPSDHIIVSQIEDDGTVFFEEYYALIKKDDGLFYLIGSSDLEMTKDEFTSEVQFSDSVKLDDSFSFLLSDEEKEEYAKQEKSGNPLFDSCFWWYSMKNIDSLSRQDPEKQGGFYDVMGACHGVEIKDGVITSIFFFWT